MLDRRAARTASPAAQDAARKFVDDQPGGTRLGIVVFAAERADPRAAHHQTATGSTAPSTGFTTSIGTAIGNGVLASIDALSRVNPDIAPSTVTLSPAERRQDRFASRYVPDVIVLLTDGAATTGVDPRDAAPAGGRPPACACSPSDSARPTPPRWRAPPSSSAVTRSSRSAAAAYRSTWARAARQLPPDRRGDAARGSRASTGGTYARAASAAQLDEAFRKLPRRIVTVKQVHELTVYLVALGAVLALGAVATARWWNRVT